MYHFINRYLFYKLNLDCKIILITALHKIAHKKNKQGDYQRQSCVGIARVSDLYLQAAMRKSMA
jgi:hypothetical protein